MGAATPLRILEYLVNIWQRELDAGRGRHRLPPIIYHGRGRWTAPSSVYGMLDAPREWAPFPKEFAYVLHDLGDIEAKRLSRKPDLRAGLLALKMAHAKAVPPDLLDLMTGGPIARTEWERHIIRHITERLHLTPPMLEASLRGTKPDRWETLMDTVAEAWVEQGRAEGQARVVLRQMELRCGALPAPVRERVHNASDEELAAWAEAVLTATSLEEALTARANKH